MGISNIIGIPRKAPQSLAKAYGDAITSFKPFGVMTPLVKKAGTTLKNKLNSQSEPISFQDTVMLPELVVRGQRPIKFNNTLKDEFKNKVLKARDEINVFSPERTKYYKRGGELVTRYQDGGRTFKNILRKYGVKDNKSGANSGILKYLSDGFGSGSFFRPFRLGDIVVNGYPQKTIPYTETVSNELGTFTFDGTEGVIPLRVEHPYGVEYNNSPVWKYVNVPEQQFRDKGLVPNSGVFPKALQFNWEPRTYSPGDWKLESEIY